MSVDAKPRVSRQEQARQAVRRRIMDEGRKLFAEKGYEATTMRDLAKATEYTPSALYYHFKDKAELMHAICSEDFAGLAAWFHAALGGTDPMENIQRLGHAYARFALAFPNHYRLMFMNAHPPTEKDLDRQGDPSQDAYAALHHQVVTAIAQGRIRPELTDSHLVAQTLWAGFHGLITLNLEKGCDHWVPWTDMQARIDLMSDALLRGVRRS